MRPPNARETVLALLDGRGGEHIPCFSGMGNVTTAGLDELGYQFARIHTDAKMMAESAMSTWRLFGFECAVAPFDMGVEAGALGAGINYYEHAEGILYPTVKEKVIRTIDEVDDVQVPEDVPSAGRIPLVAEALKMMKDGVGDEVAIGSWVLGPFTLAGQIFELDVLLKSAFKHADKVSRLTDTLADFLVEVIRVYKAAGADYITVREMGAPTDILSPRMFKSLIMPPLARVIEAIDGPSVLHICGDTNPIVEMMAECGAGAISVDQKNRLAETRAKLGKDAVIFGNYDPYGMLVKGSVEDVRAGALNCIDEGASAVWPGCDIWPTVPPENMNALVETVTTAKRPGV